MGLSCDLWCFPFYVFLNVFFGVVYQIGKNILFFDAIISMLLWYQNMYGYDVIFCMNQFFSLLLLLLFFFEIILQVARDLT